MPDQTLDEARISDVIDAVGAARYASLADEVCAGIAVLLGAPTVAGVATAHRLRGAAASLGLPALAAGLEQLEIALVHGDATVAVDVVRGLHGAVRAALSKRASR